MTVAIVEVSESHEECIYSQALFLTSANYKVDLYIHPKINSQIDNYRYLFNNIIITDFENISILKRIHQQQRLLKKLNNYDKVVFNTASSSRIVRNLCLFLLFSKTECIGVLHNIKKIEKSFTQSLISLKIKKYFVLNDFILPSREIKKIKIVSFYPIFFPSFKKDETLDKKNKIWLTVPGRLDYNRRDYNLLFETIRNCKNTENIKIILLGKISDSSTDGQKTLKKLKDLKIEENFILFNDFVDNDTFHNYLDKSDYILPLLNKSDDYLKYKITGTFNIAFAHKKIMLTNHFFKKIPDLQENSIFYTRENLTKIISNINNSILLKKDDAYKNLKWNFDVQKEQYLNLINS
ncbi:hypothetical protein M4I21_08785 [Cellulophaga sp. 20_2_10]|uniref:hypothetical protein n=1 Tax=Cellulophaga sp. 20_2_10 TaxID=2942476 RepID=UPI00201B2598|nr:hypothetical protein [Cellulophaga sp. 20_2_10]MCL5245897.1 hypothetical protein [Cellulophaga sp. 20_2_10]